MAIPVPKWVMQRYAKLWKQFGKKQFAYEEIRKVLTIDDDRVISVFLNELKKAGWINVQLDEQDTRKRIYSLREPTVIVRRIAGK